ncbi:MAG: PEP-CTERM sorting domain-containing protein, partial [Planctomycetota bacterium]
IVLTVDASPVERVLSVWVLVNGWISEIGADADPSLVTVSEIPYGKYDLYIYVGHDRADDDTVFSESGGAFTSFITLENIDDTTVAADPFVYTRIAASGDLGNYFVARGLTQSELGIEFLPGVASDSRGPLSGLQIVEVPEPSTAALAIAGAALLCCGAMRRKS